MLTPEEGGPVILYDAEDGREGEFYDVGGLTFNAN
jgi:hypothetical protein